MGWPQDARLQDLVALTPVPAATLNGIQDAIIAANQAHSALVHKTWKYNLANAYTDLDGTDHGPTWERVGSGYLGWVCRVAGGLLYFEIPVPAESAAPDFYLTALQVKCYQGGVNDFPYFILYRIDEKFDSPATIPEEGSPLLSYSTPGLDSGNWGVKGQNGLAIAIGADDKLLLKVIGCNVGDRVAAVHVEYGIPV